MIWSVGMWPINALCKVGSTSSTKVARAWNTRNVPDGRDYGQRGSALTEGTQLDGFHARIVGAFAFTSCRVFGASATQSCESRCPPTILTWNPSGCISSVGVGSLHLQSRPFGNLFVFHPVSALVKLHEPTFHSAFMDHVPTNQIIQFSRCGGSFLPLFELMV
jgi:hypothetical protein